MHNRIVVLAGNASQELARQTCERLSIKLAEAKVGRFADGEVQVQLRENVRAADVFIINATNPPAENILEMILLAEAVRGSSAARITLIPVYLGYNRQDRKDRPRVPISARVIAKMLSGVGADRVLLVDLHSEPTMGYFENPIVTDHLYASWVSVPYLKEALTAGEFVVASPDKGGGPRAEAYAHLLGLTDYVLFTKSRPEAGEVNADRVKIIGEVAGKDVLFVDDIIDTGRTLVADAAVAKAAGARNIYVFATHALFSPGAVQRLDQGLIKEVIVTDTIHHTPEELKTSNLKITVLSVDRFLADAIRRIHEGTSLSELILSKED